MRTFLQRLGSFTLLQTVPVLLLLALYRPHPDNFMAEAAVKHALLETTPSPRILFLGGSSVAFGLDCRQVAAALPVHPVNAGLHAALGIDVMLNEARRALRPGDVVVVSLEYDHFLDDTTSDVIWDELDYRPGAWRDFAWPDVKAALDTLHVRVGTGVRGGMRRLLGRAFAVSPVAPYRLDSFDELGDVVAHWDPAPGSDAVAGPARAVAPAAPDISQAMLLRGAGPTTPLRLARPIGRLNAFESACRERGATAFFAFPPVPAGHLARSREPIERIHRALATRCTMPLLDTPDEAALPLDCFYDTTYHLNQRGAALRTARLTALLSARIPRD